MSSTPSPTWYDVLGVSRDASPETIKASWRTATDKFEPGSGSGQFRMFNEAADVLLDPVRRAAYDATLAPLDEPAAVEPEVETPEAAAAPEEPLGEAPSETPDDDAVAPPPSPTRAPRRPAGRLLVVLTAALALLTVVALVLAGWFGLQLRKDAAVDDARDEAPAAAETAAKAIFSYDYRQLDADKQRAKGYLTASYGAQYLKAFDRLQKQSDGTPGLAVQTRTTVKSTVLGSGVVDAEDGVARVLVYVNLTSTRPGRTPQIFQNRVAMKMVKDGNRWLVDKVDTY